MELVIVIIGIGLSLILNIIAIMIFHTFAQEILSSVLRTRMMLVSLIGEQEKKTRKDVQEVKTRLSQVRKDLNKLEGWTTTHIEKGQVGFRKKSNGSNIFPISEIQKKQPVPPSKKSGSELRFG